MFHTYDPNILAAAVKMYYFGICAALLHALKIQTLLETVDIIR
jgi:hypothetical protein